MMNDLAIEPPEFGDLEGRVDAGPIDLRGEMSISMASRGSDSPRCRWTCAQRPSAIGRQLLGREVSSTGRLPGPARSRAASTSSRRATASGCRSSDVTNDHEADQDAP